MILKRVDIDSDEYVKFSRQSGGVFNQPEWLKIYDEKLQVIGIYNLNNELTGCFNVYLSKKLFFNFLFTPPYTPNNALCFVNPAQNASNIISYEKELHQAIVGFLSGYKGTILMSAFPYNIIDTQIYFWNKFKVIPNYTYVLDLLPDNEWLFNNLSAEKRKSIRKAENDNLLIKENYDYKIVQELILKTFSRKNKSTNSVLLEKILFQYATASNSYSFVAYKNNAPVACTFVVHYNNYCYYLFGGYDTHNKHHGAGPACMWHSILKAKELGVKYFDFEGSMLPEVEKYFRDFGGKIVPYYTIQKACLPVEILLKLKFRNRF